MIAALTALQACRVIFDHFAWPPHVVDMGYHVKADHMGYHVSVCLSVALFLVYMVNHGASPRYHGASPITNSMFALMRRFLVYMVAHGVSMGNHVNQKQRDGQTDTYMVTHVNQLSHGSPCQLHGWPCKVVRNNAACLQCSASGNRATQVTSQRSLHFTSIFRL